MAQGQMFYVPNKVHTPNDNDGLLDNLITNTLWQNT